MPDEVISKKALLVDDDLIALTVHRLPLIQAGFIVDEAKNGEEALNKLIENKGQYALVLMDYNLPDVNGAIVTQKIRCLEKDSNFTHHLPIIGITAHVDDAIKQSCFSAGMDNVLSKPVLSDKLEMILDQYCKLAVAE